MNAAQPVPFRPEWPEPDRRLLQEDLPSPPELPLGDILSERWAAWIRNAAEAKAAPPDYVFAALLTAASSLIGNARWVSPWDGWQEPPTLWSAIIGNPSTNKSPAIDAVLGSLRRAERVQRDASMAALTEWREKADIAKVAEASWKEGVKSAFKMGDTPPSKPDCAQPGPEPVVPRLVMSDTTVEKLAMILSSQPRGTLVFRDELSGWLQSMTRYSGGGSDRPFWLEAYGGRAYSVERINREPVYINHMSVGVLGGIQPDRLRTLLMKSDDDGLLARFLPIWPGTAPVKRPRVRHDDSLLNAAIGKLQSLAMVEDKDGHNKPQMVGFTEEAREVLDTFRAKVRVWENESDGLLLSFIGKLPGLSLRLSLTLGMLNWSIGSGPEPQEIIASEFLAVTDLLETYVLPMARRAYSDNAFTKEERAGRCLIHIIRAEGWRKFSSRDVRRMQRSGLTRQAEIDHALAALEDAEIIRSIEHPRSGKGGRPKREYAVNPAILGV